LSLAESWTHYAVIYERDNGAGGRRRHEENFACIDHGHRVEPTRAQAVGRSVTGSEKFVPFLYFIPCSTSANFFSEF